MPRLEDHLVLNRYFHRLLGADDFETLKRALDGVEEGPAADGQSFFYGALVGRVPEGFRAQLGEYDHRVMGYEARLARARGGLRLRYFQYLALLYTEMFLDALTADPVGLLADLNRALHEWQRREPHLRNVADFTPADLRRVAFFMATGSGKTLLLHVNLWQVLHYLEHGRHPEALVDRADGRRAFDNILLVTPGEGLSAQHLNELRLSGIDAVHLTDASGGAAWLGPQVKVVEIHKLAEQASGEGVSIPLESLGGCNLVFVDEGHKGTGSEAQTWKRRQQALSEAGFALEYSATFAQAIGAAGPRAKERLLGEYGKAILFDYSYRHFYGDRYGKDFRVLNLEGEGEAHAQELLVGGLLIFYQQVHLYRTHGEAYRPYNLEAPLWVFVGSSVQAMYTRGGRARSDVAAVVAFLRRFLEDESWAVATLGRVLAGQSGFTDGDTGQDLFAPHLEHLPGEDPAALYRRICEEVFRGRGALEVWELKNADGELGLRASNPGAGAANPYFGVVNIGDVSAFKKHLRESMALEVGEDQFTGSLFAGIDRPDSPVTVLVGARKFIEGWSSWRVSTMGLLNMGRGEGSLVIQLFGRGVRLKGRGMSLQRSGDGRLDGHPAGLEKLETLHIFGWNADYIQAFRAMLEREELPQERQLPVRPKEPWPELLVPRPTQGYDVSRETWTLAVDTLRVDLDLTSQITALAGRQLQAGALAGGTPLDFARYLPLLDLEALYLDLLEYKRVRGYGNLYMPRGVLGEILTERCEVRLPQEDLRHPERVQEAALRALRTYVDRFYARQERAAESQHLEPQRLGQDDPNVIRHYTLRVSDTDLLRQIEALIADEGRLGRESDEVLPRLHMCQHLYNPLLRELRPDGKVSMSPPGLSPEEADFVKDLRDYWASHHAESPYREWEVFLLRNLPKVGVGFFHRSGFYPDFILWVQEHDTSWTRVVFVEPHGLHHGGLSGNADKIAALKELERLGQADVFRQRRVLVDGYLLTRTELCKIPGAEQMNWAQLERDHKVLRQERDYIRTLLHAGHGRGSPLPARPQGGSRPPDLDKQG